MGNGKLNAIQRLNTFSECVCVFFCTCLWVANCLPRLIPASCLSFQHKKNCYGCWLLHYAHWCAHFHCTPDISRRQSWHSRKKNYWLQLVKQIKKFGRIFVVLVFQVHFLIRQKFHHFAVKWCLSVFFSEKALNNCSCYPSKKEKKTISNQEIT